MSETHTSDPPAAAPADAAVGQRVLFLTDIITPYVCAILSALARRVDVTAVFCAADGSRSAGWSFADGLPFRHEVVGGLTIRRSGGDATDYYLSPRILGALRRHQPDAVISAGWSIPTVYAALYARLRGAGLVIYSDGTVRSERSLSLLQRAARRVLLLTRPICVAKSDESAQRFVELGVPPQRLFLAPHSTDVARFRRVFDGRRPPTPGRLQILNVGRLIPRKGLDRLVDAAALAAREEPGITLVLVGTGPEEEALRARAAHAGVSVEFRGFVDQAQLPAVYAEADVFAFPTLDDPFGMVVLEAAASGLPIVASPYGGATADIVADGETGFVIEPDDVEGMAAAFVRLAREPQLRLRLGRGGHDRTLDRTPDRAADGYAAAVRAATGRQR